MTPADFLGNLNSFLDDEDSADADILKKMVVDACINIGVPEALNKSLVEITGSLSTASTIHQVFPTEYAQHALSLFQGDFAIARHANVSSFPPASSSSMWMTRSPNHTANVTEEVKQAQRETRKMLSDSSPKKNDPTPIR